MGLPRQDAKAQGGWIRYRIKSLADLTLLRSTRLPMPVLVLECRHYGGREPLETSLYNTVLEQLLIEAFSPGVEKVFFECQVST